MSKKTNTLRTKTINLYITPSSFESLLRKFSGEKKQYDFSGITDVRKLLNNEKARILHFIKEKNPESIYHLAKLLERDFKSVRKDIKLLEKFGFIHIKHDTQGTRKKLKPEVIIDELILKISFQ